MSNFDDGYMARAENRLGTVSDFLLREIPYLVILVLTVAGAGYVSLMRRPIVHYWDFVAVLIAVICVVVGWRRMTDNKERWHLVWTQVLHWGAFLIAMNMVFLPSMQSILNADSTSLVVLFTLALGTFVAGVHTSSVRLCANGAVMAALVPAIAWLDQSALILSLVALLLLGIGAAFLWHRFGRARD